MSHPFAAYANYPYIAYKTSKAGFIALTQHIAISNAEYGIRANVVVPGLINTPMAVEAAVSVFLQAVAKTLSLLETPRSR